MGPHADHVAVAVPNGPRLTYAEFQSRVDAVAADLPREPCLVMITGDRDLTSVLTFLASLQRGHSVHWSNVRDADRASRLVAAYKPNIVIGHFPIRLDLYRSRTTTHAVWWERTGSHLGSVPTAPHLLLDTSGSASAPKAAALSATSLRRAASATAAAMGIETTSVGITSLPLHHILGLSVLTSHLAAGATIVLSSRGPTSVLFWRTAGDHQVTSVTVTPSQAEVLRERPHYWTSLASLTSLAISGAPLRSELALALRTSGQAHGVALTQMYGQTETTGRITVLAQSSVADHPQSVGMPIPGTRVTIDGSGHVRVASRSLMSGYVRTREELATIGTAMSEQDTGDLGELIAGHLYLRGRANRIAKPHGVRVSLDEIEQLMAPDAAALADDDERIHVFITSDREPGRTSRLVEAEFALPAGSVAVHPTAQIPLKGTGKVDYEIMRSLLAYGQPTDRKLNVASPSSSSAIVESLLRHQDVDFVEYNEDHPHQPFVVASRRPVLLPELRLLLRGDDLPHQVAFACSTSTGPTTSASKEVLTLWSEPSDETDEEVQRIWVDVLNPPGPTSMHDRFSDLGGDSLAALEILTVAETAWGVRSDLNWLLTQGTAQRMADLVRIARE